MRVALIAISIVLLAARAHGSPCETRPPCGAAPTRELEIEMEVDDASSSPAHDRYAPSRRPSIGEVMSAAYAAAGLDRNPARGWIRRARLAGLVPWVTVRTGRDTSWHDDDPAIGHSMALEVRATWRLDRLLFDNRELQVASIESARRRERRRLASRVIRTYFTWRRANERSDLGSRTDEAAAELDALTDGWFSDQLAGSRRGASEPRTP